MEDSACCQLQLVWNNLLFSGIHKTRVTISILDHHKLRHFLSLFFPRHLTLYLVTLRDYLLFIETRMLKLDIPTFYLKASGPCLSKSNQYGLISQISIIGILYSPGILHFMYRLPMKTWAWILSRRCHTWPLKLITCQNYLMLNAAGSILTL